MTQVIKRCDLCAKELLAEALFDSLTLSMEIGGVTTWQLCALCSDALFKHFEQILMAFTRNRPREVPVEEACTE